MSARILLFQKPQKASAPPLTAPSVEWDGDDIIDSLADRVNALADKFDAHMAEMEREWEDPAVRAAILSAKLADD